MRNFQRKTSWKRVLQSWPALAIFGMFVLFFAWGVWGLLAKLEITTENEKLVEAKVNDLEAKKEKLTNDIDQLKTVEGQEASIREKFGLAKDGEGLIVVVDDKPAVPETKPQTGFFATIKKWFKN